MSDSIKNDTVKTEDLKYPSVSYVEELGSATAEAICANMRPANDDMPVFGTSMGLTGISSNPHIDAASLAKALHELRSHASPAPFFKGKFMQNTRVILGKEDKI